MIQDFKYYRPGLGGSWLLVGLTLAGSLVGGIATAMWPAAPQSLTYAIMMSLPLAWCLVNGQHAAAMGEIPTAINEPRFGKLGAALFLGLAALAMLTMSVVIEPTTTFIPMPDSIKAIFEKAFVDSALWDMILSTCILAPLLEELLCRGMMLRGMLDRGKEPWKAIFWSAFLFSFMHLNPWQSIPAFLMGLFLSWVYWRTRCLWATIFLHCLNNSISTAISRIWPDMSIDTGLKDILAPNTYWTVYVVSAFVLVVTLYVLYEKTLPPEVQTGVEA